MQRIATITAIIFAALLTVFAIIWFGVFHTPPGRAMLSGVIEKQLGAALNSEAEVGAFKGAPPGHIVFEDIALEDAEGPWLTVQRAEVRWRPLALIRKRIIVDLIDVDSPHLLRNPPPGEPKQEESGQLSLSFNAPDFTLTAFDLSDFQAPVNGEMERLDANGSIRLNGTDINLQTALSSSGGRDRADISFEKSPRRDIFLVESTFRSESDGVVATILGLEGPLDIEARGDGAIDDAEINLQGVIGGYGELRSTIGANFDNFTGADVNINFTAGERLSGVEELSAPIDLDARIDLNNDGGAMTVRSLSSGVGDTNGDITWRSPGGDVDQLNVTMNIQFADNYRPDIQSYLGETADIIAELNWRSDDYALTAAVDGALASIEIQDGRTDLSRRFAGVITANLAANDTLPPIIASGVEASGEVDIDLDRSMSGENLVVRTSDGASFNGRGAYETDSETITAAGDFTLTSAALRALAPEIEAGGDISGDFDLSGPADDFTLETEFETPQLTFTDGALPPMAMQAALSGLPNRPNGDILATARNDAPRRLEAQLRSSGDGKIRAPKILYAGRGFQLDGAGDFDPGPQTVNIDLSYSGENGAQPWPGLTLAGGATIDGVLSREGALNNLQVEAPSLAFNDISVSGMSLTAEGPPGAVNVTLAGDVFSAPGAGEITDYRAEAQVNLQAAPKVMLTQFEAVIANNNTRMTEPATISLENGVRVETLRLAYGANGSIALDGALQPERWIADAKLVNVNIPEADGQITLDLSLDTDEQTPARADFALRSLLLNEEEASIAGNLVWDGESLTVRDDDADEKIDMRIVLPARLTRTPAISISSEGPLDGFIRYDGDIQAIAAYLPPTLQTMEGKLDADFRLGGDTSAPDLSGSATLMEGAYTELSSGFSLAGLHAEAQASYENGRSVVTFTGGGRGADQSGDDTITLTGDLTVGEDSRIDLEAQMNDAELSAHPVNNIRANGSLKITGPMEALKAEGDIVIDELDAEIVTPESTGLVDIEVVAYNDENESAAQAPEERTSNIEYSIKLSADDRIFIRGRGLESEWSANATVVNGREQPVIVGDLSLRRGWLDFSGRRFDLTRGGVKFDLLSVNNPVVDIRAEHETSEGVTAAIVISGRAMEPQITLESTPSMPQEDIMALVLFGKPAEQLTPLESLQAAQALASLGGIGPFGGSGGGLTGRLRSAVGLDLLNVDIDPESGGGSLTVGKYVADGFFVSASQDAEGKNGAVRVKYEITDNITVETEIEQTGDQTVSANWEKDF
ncbi:translocation/assembly module TamB domain-containing protein [Hyphococcus sp.]|uniref:translocation/assembly module TamB domain-containing protein n=1 Tax=Hyphococcus sp. TaxID=2038636 RepID=UPI003CCBBCB2